MAAAEPSAAALPGGVGAGSGAPSGAVPVLFCFSVFARPSSVPHGAGYELLIQKFLSLYGDQIDRHRKFVVQLFAEEWGQYVDLPKGFAVSERCKVRLVPLQIQVGAAGPRRSSGARARPSGAPAARRRLRGAWPPLPVRVAVQRDGGSVSAENRGRELARFAGLGLRSEGLGDGPFPCPPRSCPRLLVVACRPPTLRQPLDPEPQYAVKYPANASA